ncbi:hypothetical protein KAR91_07220 [Candidatus Pacearchaeota archaeon]|nr:hypothetical protein [Candidatus Pacearchaeota archaeon]
MKTTCICDGVKIYSDDDLIINIKRSNDKPGCSIEINAAGTLKKKERTYKIGDRFRDMRDDDIYMIIKCGTDEVNIVKLENPSGKRAGVAETRLWDGIKIKDKYNITKEELIEGWRWFFDDYELIED